MPLVERERDIVGNRHIDGISDGKTLVMRRMLKSSDRGAIQIIHPRNVAGKIPALRGAVADESLESLPGETRASLHEPVGKEVVEIVATQEDFDGQGRVAKEIGQSE